MKQATIADFLTAEQIAKAISLWQTKTTTQQFHRDVLEQIVLPNMPEINRKLGQANDPGYIAYALQYIFTTAERGDDDT